MRPSRRQFLALCVGTSLAGCLDSTSEPEPSDIDNDGVPDSEDLYPTDPLRSEDARIESPGDITLESGGFYRIPLASQKARPLTVTYSVEVQNGLAVNVFLIDRDEYREYNEGGNFEYYPDASRLVTTSAEATFHVRDSEFFLIIEHPETDQSIGTPIELTVDLNGYY